MNYSLQYIRIEFKRAVRAFLSGLATLIIISAITVGSAAALYTLLQSLGISEPVKVAVAVPGDGSMSRMAIRLLEGMDSIKAVCEFELTDEADAREGMYDGRFGAAIVLPENFYEGVNYGINPPALILIPSDITPGVRNFGELLETATSLVDTVEGGIYAVTDAGSVYGMKVARTDMENYLTNIAFDTLLKRTKFFGESFESSLDVSGLVSYYAVCAGLLIVMITCTGFGYLYSKRSKSVEHSLRRIGLGPVKTGFVKLLVEMCQLVLIFTIYLLVLRLFSHILISRESEALILSGGSVLEACEILSGFKNVIPVLFCICGFSHFIYCLFRGREDSGLILLIIFMIMLVLGGCIVPSVFLPDTAVSVGRFMPAALWRDDIFNGGIVRELITGVVLFAVGEVLSWLNT